MDITSIPSTIFHHSILQLVESTDILSFRACSTYCHEIVHASTGHENVWRAALCRDFSFAIDREGATDSIRSEDSSVSPLIAATHHLQSLTLPESLRTETRFKFATPYDVSASSTPFESWKAWRKASLRYYHPDPIPSIYRGISAPYFLRAARFWRIVYDWCDGNGTTGEKIRRSLKPGTNSRFVPPSHTATKPGLRGLEAIYAFHGGQSTPIEPRSEEDVPALFMGVLGGYSAYNHHMNARFLSTDYMLEMTSEEDRSESMIPIAASYQGSKCFRLNAVTGELLLFYVTDMGDASIPVVPSEGVHGKEGDHLDCVLRWVEEMARRLDVGYYRMGNILSGNPTFNTGSILLYPNFSVGERSGGNNEPSIVSRSVTRGVEVVASAIFVPELLSSGICFIYSIRIKILCPEEDGYLPAKERGFVTCQLQRRNWEITNDDTGTTDSVSGDGVIGLYPLLKERRYMNYRGNSTRELCPHAEEVEGGFVYQSCCDKMRGSFRGAIDFVPGSLYQPSGESFSAEVAPFLLDPTPDFIF